MRPCAHLALARLDICFPQKRVIFSWLLLENLSGWKTANFRLGHVASAAGYCSVPLPMPKVCPPKKCKQLSTGTIAPNFLSTRQRTKFVFPPTQIRSGRQAEKDCCEFIEQRAARGGSLVGGFVSNAASLRAALEYLWGLGVRSLWGDSFSSLMITS
jgi:hypothetical protein